MKKELKNGKNSSIDKNSLFDGVSFIVHWYRGQVKGSTLQKTCMVMFQDCKTKKVANLELVAVSYNSELQIEDKQ